MSELKEVIEKINKYLVEKGYRDDSPDLTESKIKLFDDYREAILDYNEKVNITRIVERDDFERRHYIDSLMCCISDEFLSAKTIIDIGSGGGFPGVPLAVMFPEKDFVLGGIQRAVRSLCFACCCCYAYPF